jgi:hypothetical protein
MQKEPSVGEKIIEALTEEQLAHLLDVLLDKEHEVPWHKLRCLTRRRPGQWSMSSPAIERAQ